MITRSSGGGGSAVVHGLSRGRHTANAPIGAVHQVLVLKGRAAGPTTSIIRGSIVASRARRLHTTRTSSGDLHRGIARARSRDVLVVHVLMLVRVLLVLVLRLSTDCLKLGNLI